MTNADGGETVRPNESMVESAGEIFAEAINDAESHMSGTDISQGQLPEGGISQSREPSGEEQRHEIEGEAESQPDSQTANGTGSSIESTSLDHLAEIFTTPPRGRLETIIEEALSHEAETSELEEVRALLDSMYS